MVEENVDHTDVIATGSPMERGLGMAAGKLRVDIGTGRNQLCYGLSIIREMASTLVFARLEFCLRSRFNVLVSPLEIASTAAAARSNNST